jgi:small-conductance mechanosensitive channel
MQESRMSLSEYLRPAGRPSWAAFMLSILIVMIPVLILANALYAEGPPSGRDLGVNYSDLNASIDQTIVKEKENRNGFTQELMRARESETVYKSDLSALKVQYSVYSNLVIMPETDVKAMEQAFSDNLAKQALVASVMADLKDKKVKVKTILGQTEEQIRLNSEQLDAIKNDKRSPANDYLKPVDKLEELQSILNEKKKTLATLAGIYDDYSGQYGELEKQFASLSVTFDNEIKHRKKQDLFQRKKNVLFSKKTSEMMDDVRELLAVPKILISKDQWATNLGIHEGNDYSYAVIFGLLFIFFQYVMIKGKDLVRFIKEKPYVKESFWGNFTATLFEKSIFILGNLVLLSVCDSFLNLRLKFPLIEPIEQGLVVFLLSRWSLDFLKMFPRSEEGFPPDALISMLRRIVRLFRYFSLIYIAGLWFLSVDNVLFVLIRMAFAVIIWLELFGLGKSLMSCVATININTYVRQAVCQIPKIGYVFLFFGLLLDLRGYSQLAMFLSASIGETLLVLMWSGLFFRLLLEFKESVKKEESVQDDTEKSSINTHWFFTLFYSIVWLAFSLVAMIYVWGGKQAAVTGIYKLYTTPISVGNMNFSLFGITVAFFVLFLTHLVAKAWRELFQKKLLNESGMDIGVQESITTISIYLIWTAGILVALNVFGLNMTSITVVLGALGIGIGFGLQNIFNNFLSGIILLFERPIKVGDELEINGVWATVKKINVRSTVVQTYDNATLIIPNSDFISSQEIGRASCRERVS